MRKKQLVLSLLVIAMVFSLAYPCMAETQIDLGLGPIDDAINWGLGKIGGGAKAIVGFTMAGVTKLFLEGAQGLLKGASWFTEWVVSDPVGKSLSYTDPGRNLFIRVGWTLLRDLTNIMFILGLAYIGLATALDWANFDTKKTFGKLIIVALLINFSPVICGVFVDISHILKNFFLGSGLSFESLNTSFQAIQDKISWTEIMSADKILQAVIAILFSFIAILILLAIGLYFLVRSIMIWLLVMISPLVFFSWIFDSTKRLWMFWKKQFILWVFAIVPLSFFIYIATYIMANLNKFTTYEGDPTGGVFPTIFPQIAVLILLLIGFFLSFQIVSLIATPIMAGARKAGKAGVALGKKVYGVGKFGAKVGGVAGAGVMGGIKEVKETGEIRRLGLGVLKGLTPRGRQQAKDTIGGGLDKAGFHRMGYKVRGGAQRRREMFKAEKMLEGKSTEELQKIARKQPVTKAGLFDQMSAIKKLGEKKDGFQFKNKNGDLDVKLEQRILKQAKDFGLNLTDVLKSRPELATTVYSEKIDKLTQEILDKAPSGTSKMQAKRQAEREVIGDGIKKINPRDFARLISSESLKNTDVFMSLGQNQIKTLGERGSLDQKRELAATSITRNLTDFRDYLAKQGQTAEADNIQNNMRTIAYDSNFQNL